MKKFFSPFSDCPTIQAYFSQKHSIENANNSHKQFYVILNINQIELYIYPDLLKENNLNLKGSH